jgi:hypothetical protein
VLGTPYCIWATLSKKSECVKHVSVSDTLTRPRNTYIGCYGYLDINAFRIISNTHKLPEWCCTECREAGYQYACIQNNTCRCANSYGGTRRKHDNECKKCNPNESGELCGGDSTTAVYDLGKSDFFLRHLCYYQMLIYQPITFNNSYCFQCKNGWCEN